ncbi:MAG: hypothetical protein KKA67_09755 [Spirochaetes bacterium]|nr:hypothetical protein [Spirochaetota bacterium]MBU1080741.1 hypothetical protein [Spirochaetota bacterium]
MTVSGPASRPFPAGDHNAFDVVVRSYVALDRNLEGRRFPHALRRDEASEIAARLCGAARGRGFEVARIGDLDGRSRSNLAERELYSRPYLLDDDHYAVLSPGKPLWIAVNDANHVSFRACRPGLDLEAAWEDASAADDSMSGASGGEWAFDPDLGFIMTEAAACGSGLQATLSLHMPALVISGLAETALKRALEAGFIVAGAYSNTASAGGALFDLSLPSTHRDPELEAMGRLAVAAKALADYERRAREQLLARSPWDILDVVGRAAGRAAGARLVSRDEAAEIVSGLRLGLACGALGGMGLESATELWSSLRVRPSTVQRDKVSSEEEPEAAERARALRLAVTGIRFTERYNDV